MRHAQVRISVDVEDDTLVYTPECTEHEQPWRGAAGPGLTQARKRAAAHDILKHRDDPDVLFDLPAAEVRR